MCMSRKDFCKATMELRKKLWDEVNNKDCLNKLQVDCCEG